MNLDAGSGPNPRPGNYLHIDIVPYDYPLFFKVDVEKGLPFPDNFFPKVYSSHLLEHVKNPLFTLREFNRVAVDEVEIRVPEKCYQYNEQKDHYYTWTRETLRNLMELVFDDVEVKSNFRVHGYDSIRFLRFEGLVRLLRLITKHEIIATGRPRK